MKMRSFTADKTTLFVIAFVIVDFIFIGIVGRALWLSLQPVDESISQESNEEVPLSASPKIQISPSLLTEQQLPIPKVPGTQAILPQARSIPQTFNNCGPATTAMALEYFGHIVSQEETKSKLRTNADDKNVFTYEIAEYLKNDYGIQSKLQFGGDVQRLKTLLANGFYIMIEDWLHPNEDIGHNTLIHGYDDSESVFYFDDSYLGNQTKIQYELFDSSQWKAFNREYLVMYRPEQEPLLRSILGDEWDFTTMYQHATDDARAEIQKNENDMHAWFNLGTSLYALRQYSEAKDAFERSRAIGWPGRMLWYQIQPVQTYNILGEHQKAIELADIGLRGNDSFAELHFEKAVAYKGLGQLDAARREVERTIQLSPNYQPALELRQSL